MTADDLRALTSFNVFGDGLYVFITPATRDALADLIESAHTLDQVQRSLNPYRGDTVAAWQGFRTALHALAALDQEAST